MGNPCTSRATSRMSLASLLCEKKTLDESGQRRLRCALILVSALLSVSFLGCMAYAIVGGSPPTKATERLNNYIEQQNHPKLPRERLLDAGRHAVRVRAKREARASKHNATRGPPIDARVDRIRQP